jgi:hypothetical protein
VGTTVDELARRQNCDRLVSPETPVAVLKKDRMSAAEYRAGAAKVPLEEQECKWLFEWAQTQRFGGWKLSDVLVHVPNGAYHGADRKSGAVVARKLREQGVQPGVFDYILPVPIMRLQIPGLWLEMKRTKGGTVSAEQKKFESRMIQLGWACEIAKGWIDAAAIIDQHLKLAEKNYAK